MNDRIIAQLINVSKYYGSGEGRVTALNHVNLSFFRGDIVVLVGLSGSGKSTLLHLLGCIDNSSMSLEQLANLRLSKIGFVFQSFNLIPVLTAYENVELPLLFKDMDKKSIRQRVDEVLDEVGLHDRKHHYPREMSGGQQQRVAIARAVVKNPALILCDEPTGALDYDSSKLVLKLLEDVNKKFGTTILIITHNLAISKMADATLRLRSGRLVEFSENSQKISAQEVTW